MRSARTAIGAHRGRSDGFIMAMGCAIPPNAKFENVQAMVDSVR